MTRAVKPAADQPEAANEPALIEALIAAATIEAPTSNARQAAADTVFDIAGGDPEMLQRARVALQKRLAKRSDDFAAGRGLRVVRAALERTAPPEGPWRWQQR